MFNRLNPSELQSAIVRHPLIVKPDTTVMDAIAQMSGVRTLCETTKTVNGQLDELYLEARSSCILVVEEGKLLGILTERDVVRLSAQECYFENLAIREVMTYPVVTMHESDFTDLFFTVNLLQQQRIRHLPILDDRERVVGLVTNESLRQSSRPVDLLRLRLVFEVMTSEVICAALDSSMLAIAQLMAKHRLSSIMIVQPGGSQTEPLQIPVGIITERDIVQFQALGLNLKTCLAEAVMSTPIFAVKPDDSLWVVQQIMEQRLIRRLAVTGEQGELLGIVTQTSLLQALNPLELYNLAEVLQKKSVRLEAEKIEILETRNVELEQQVEARMMLLIAKAERERLVLAIALQIRSSLSLQTILDSTVKEVRQLLGCDRVNIWQFEADWQTIAVAESTDSSLSLVGQRVGDTCLKQDYTEIYRQGRIRIVSDIYKAKISDCHRDMLIRLQTRAKILVPLFCGDELWGLLNVAESQHPRDWEPEEVELLQVLSVQLAVALQQATTHQKLQEQLIERQQAENRLRESEQRYIILNQELEAKVAERTTKLQEREAQLQRISERLVLSLKSAAIGCWEWDIEENTILWDERMYALYGVTKTSDSYLNYDIWANGLHPDDRNPTEILLQQAVLGKAEYDTEFRVVHSDDSIHFIKAYGMVVRDAQGNPQKMIGVHFDISDRKRAELALQSSEMRFRRIFDSNVVGMLFADFQGKIFDANDRFLQMVGYTRNDLDAGTIDWLRMTPPEHISSDFVAMKHLMQHSAINPWEKEYYRKDGSKIPVLIGAAILPGSDNQTICIVVDISEQQAALRERKQAEETIRQQVEREQLLREITQRIRQSLDLHTIFVTACQEIRQVIQADRVGIFKFYSESNFNDGEFVAESVVEGFASVVAIRLHDHCFGENYSSFYALGRFHVVDDIYNGTMTPCHIDILAQFQVRATLVVPLLCGNKLWGLLCIHQCATTRHWRQFEIDFTQQLSNQLAIAIQQANLYEQIQSELLVRQKTEARIALQLRRQQTLGTIIQKIRESLDINEILATVTQQVKDILHSDRVIVFRLFADGRSQIVQEALSGEFPALKDRHWDNEVWSQEILDCYWQGKPRIVPDVTNDIWASCLVEFSREGQIQSKIVAPILQDVRGSENHRWVAPSVTNKLWGVLVVHACQEKRVWKDSEAQLLQQIANQLAIAIQQAGLFEQLQQELAERQQAEAKLTDSNQQLAVSNQELARATRLKDEFLANMSHELRTPLNAILGMTEGLQEEVFGVVTEQQLKALRTIERSGSHLLELITDILDVAKIEAGQIELDYASISVARLCQSSLVFIKQQALQKRIQLEIKLQTNLPDLLVDERRIRQVLINLLNNAVKFTPERGRVTLEVTQLFRNISTTDLTEQHFLHFAVTDTGIGISPENIKKLFQPFVQIDSALNRQYAGTGLGLALVKRIVELHGGSVGLTSELGVGSCFTIDLPYTPSFGISPEMKADDQLAVAPERDSASTEEAASLTPLILLAEDNEANISTVSSYLKAKGYRIVLAQNGQEAIDVAKTYHPDLILMDIQMPGMDGLEAMRQIRLDSNLVDIPIVALTALAMTGDRDRSLKAGASDYLSKPIKLKQLAITIQQLLNATKDDK
ncbi:GAF domain-containing protein [Nostoc sp. C052]|uniref:GAF domain-containing protein n=1 Tax=Nostoc sp. C052 TaxID=2576902 RepID=UPI0015C3FAD7|nr:GAF domain-containing protein [Nostoc sp. C052]QLE41327.1 GAF domain-containing protein [Nostoc sp. C052]